MKNENRSPVGVPKDPVTHPDVPDTPHPTEPEPQRDPPAEPNPNSTEFGPLETSKRPVLYVSIGSVVSKKSTVLELARPRLVTRVSLSRPPSRSKKQGPVVTALKSA